MPEEGEVFGQNARLSGGGGESDSSTGGALGDDPSGDSGGFRASGGSGRDDATGSAMGGAAGNGGTAGTVASAGSRADGAPTGDGTGGVLFGAGLVAYFPFDESSGETAANVVDTSANGTYVGNCIHPEDGAIGGAVSIRNLGGSAFTSDFVELPSGLLSNLSAASLSIWVRDLSAARQGGRLFHFSRGAGEEIYFAPHDLMPGTSREGCHLGGSHGGVPFVNVWSTSPQFTDQGWHHVVVTWDVVSIDLYIDGFLAGSGEAPGVLPADLGHTSPDWIGRTLDDDCIGLYAVIDDLRVYSRVLTSGQVAELFAMR